MQRTETLASGDHALAISDLLVFRLSILCAKSDRKAQAMLSSRYDITLSEWRVLASIAEAGQATQTRLRETLVLDKGQLSRTIAELQGRDWIRPSGTTDGRARGIELSSKGRMLYRKIFREVARANEHLVDALSLRERAVLDTALQKLTIAADLAFAMTGHRR